METMQKVTAPTPAQVALGVRVLGMTLALRGAYEATLNRTGRGAKLRRSFEEVVSSVGMVKLMREAYDRDPVAGYIAVASLRRPMTEKEEKEVQESPEVQAQGILPCGEPAQRQRFLQTPVLVTEDDANGEALTEAVEYAAKQAARLAQASGETLFIRYQPNAVTRGARSDGPNALRARYGGRIYVSDQPDHSGTLYAIVTPNESKQARTAHVEWAVPGFDK